MESIRLRGFLMKDSKKEHRISDLKEMINNVTDEEDFEEDKELIDYLKEGHVENNDDNLEINDEFIYHPGNDDVDAINLEENPINEDYVIKAPKVKKSTGNDYDEYEDDLVGEISENFDNVIHAKIKGRSVFAMVGIVLGVIFIILSVFIFQSRSDRVVDNVVAGETSFMFVIFLIAGLFLLIYGIYKVFNIKNPFGSMTSKIDSIDNDDKKDDKTTPKEKPSPKVLPKSEIPLDKDSYKIGEFDMDAIRNSLKKPATSTKNQEPIEENVEDIPPAKEKVKEELTAEEIEQIEYEQAKLENESIDDIFAEVDEMEDIPLISIDTKEEK